MTIARQALLAALMLGTFTAGAAAQQPTQAQANAIRQSCRGDYEARCASVPPGGTAALQCLKDNMASLSPPCQSAVGAATGAATGATARPPAPPPPASLPRPMTMREEIALMRDACGADFSKHCQGVRLGGGRAMACLADHSESLSPTCKEAMAAARGGR